MDILEKARKVLQQPVCDHCLGRQFGQLLSGYGNAERGLMLRTLAAMSVDHEGGEPGMDMTNFAGTTFHNLELKEVLKQKKCSVCGNIFLRLDGIAEKMRKKAMPYQFRTFLVGTRLPHELIAKEEELWERVGIDYCEPLKAELNRELGKRLEKLLKVRFNARAPEVSIVVDIGSSSVSVSANPLFIYGEYQKLVRGIPQTKWPSQKYKTSVEQIIAKPFLAAAAGSSHKLHGHGREDIDARCLAWRPFVLEIISPKMRDISLKALAKKIDRKKVVVRKLRRSSIAEVRVLKEAKRDKTYAMRVKCGSAIARPALRKLSALVGEIRQRTPQRVLHRRSDRLRKRAVRKLRALWLGKTSFRLTVTGESGLYVKELVSGDNGRTRPSVSEILGAPCVCTELDVIRIHRK